MAVRDRPLFTDIFEKTSDFVPSPQSLYVHGSSFEERSGHSQQWQSNSSEVTHLRLAEVDPSTVAFEANGRTVNVPLRSQPQLAGALDSWNKAVIYVDITGLAHHIWAPVVRAALSTRRSVKAIYVEPLDYRFSATPTEGEIFDLSERIAGISPIPGFTSLAEPSDAEFCFVPLLGFEGTRLAYLIEHVQPLGGKTVPVIGVPGFRLEYPFYTYHGNRYPLTETKTWRNARYAIANCPFSLFYLLTDIAAQYPRHSLKIAPIGTKPHSLGAILFAIVSPRSVEIVYDHPIRKTGRTSGVSRLLLYHLSSFASGAIVA